MSKIIQIRNVPDEVHAELVRRARLRHQTLSEYLQRMIARDLATPPMEELIARIEARPPPPGSWSSVDLIHEARQEHDRELVRRIGLRVAEEPPYRTDG